MSTGNQRRLRKINWEFKTLGGILFNVGGAYLLFFPQEVFPSIMKIVGVIGLLFSYYVFYLDIYEEENN